jgi:hypothetical protein
MEHLDFILWMVLYPIMGSITTYLGAKQRKIEGKPNYSKDAEFWGVTISISVWILIGVKLF